MLILTKIWKKLCPNHKIPWIFVMIIAMGLTIPVIFQKGMHLDGTIYAAISLNLSNNVGTFWNPQLSQTYFNSFHEHPPFALWLQSLFFWAIGDHYFIERLYALIVILFSGLLMAHLWRMAPWPDKQWLDFTWVPILFWIIIPNWSWAYRNNALENTMTFFCLLTVYLQAIGLSRKLLFQSLFFALMASLGTLAAFLSKGPASLFVLSAPFFFWMMNTFEDKKKFIIFLSGYFLFTIILFVLILQYPQGAAALNQYWKQQVSASLQGHRVMSGDSHFYILAQLAYQLTPVIAVLLLSFVIGRKSFLTRPSSKLKLIIISFLGIAFSASLPLILVKKQATRYLNPSFPFFAIALSAIFIVMILHMKNIKAAFFEKRPPKIFILCMGIIAAAILTFSIANIDKVYKNKDYFHDLDIVAKIVENQQRIGIMEKMYEDWYLHSIAQRHYNLTLDTNLEGLEFLLVEKSMKLRVTSEYQKLNTPTRRWDLYRLIYDPITTMTH